MRCPSCDKEDTGQNNFCSQCGQRLRGISPIRKNSVGGDLIDATVHNSAGVAIGEDIQQNITINPPSQPPIPPGEYRKEEHSFFWGLYRKTTSWKIITGGAILLIAASIGLLLALNLGVPLGPLSPNRTPIPEGTVTTIESRPTAAATLTPTRIPRVLPETPQSGRDFPLGEPVWITEDVQAGALRNGPGLVEEPLMVDGEIIEVQPFQQVTIIGGAINIDGLTWWEVDVGNGNIGWIADDESGKAVLVLTPQPSE